MRSANHHSCMKGKRVRIQLSNGNIIVGKFIETRSKHISVDVDGNRCNFRPRDVVMFTINKPK